MLKDSTVLNSFSFDSILVGPWLVDGLLSAMNFKFQRAEYALTVLILHLVDDPFSTDFIIIIYCSALWLLLFRLDMMVVFVGITTRFHSFTDGKIPSVCDKKFVGDFFSDVITDGLRPSALPSSVIPHSVAISVGKTKKPFADGFTDGICAQKKKKIPAWNIPTDFYSVGILWLTDENYPSVNLSVSVWNTDRICPFVNSSVIVEATVKCRRIKSVGKSVGECLKYRPN